MSPADGRPSALVGLRRNRLCHRGSCHPSRRNCGACRSSRCSAGCGPARSPPGWRTAWSSWRQRLMPPRMPPPRRLPSRPRRQGGGGRGRGQGLSHRTLWRPSRRALARRPGSCRTGWRSSNRSRMERQPLGPSGRPRANTSSPMERPWPSLQRPRQPNHARQITSRRYRRSTFRWQPDRHHPTRPKARTGRTRTTARSTTVDRSIGAPPGPASPAPAARRLGGSTDPPRPGHTQ
ncbi:MAG: hypothetical protein JWO31_3632 [Phycisphaerales bacterium]|nr:hypothetical protein [Phycisphaerales bacterium]